MTTTPLPTVAEALHEQYVRYVRSAARRLRDLADDFEQKALDVRAQSSYYNGAGPHAVAADRAIDAVTSYLANAKIGSIVTSGAAADAALVPPLAEQVAALVGNAEVQEAYRLAWGSGDRRPTDDTDARLDMQALADAIHKVQS